MCRAQTVVLLGKFAPHPLDTAAESLKKEALTQARTRGVRPALSCKTVH
jgi:hypothetical protein